MYICETENTRLMERMTVAVAVHPTIREFIIDTNGSDTIVPDKSDLLWKLVKANLTTYKNVNTENDSKSCIYIELLQTGFHKSYNNGSMLYISTMYHCYLTEAGQNQVAKELRSRFKNTFHTFVMGALVGNPGLKQKEAFILFIDKFRLSENSITYEMLKKSWDRSLQKEIMKSKKTACLISF